MWQRGRRCCGISGGGGAPYLRARAGYQIGFGPITWLLISEVFPLRTRGRAFALATTANFAVNLTVALVNPPLTESLGQVRSH